jgi:hypothetical protein
MNEGEGVAFKSSFDFDDALLYSGLSSRLSFLMELKRVYWGS